MAAPPVHSPGWLPEGTMMMAMPACRRFGDASLPVYHEYTGFLSPLQNGAGQRGIEERPLVRFFARCGRDAATSPGAPPSSICPDLASGDLVTASILRTRHAPTVRR